MGCYHAKAAYLAVEEELEKAAVGEVECLVVDYATSILQFDKKTGAPTAVASSHIQNRQDS